MLSCLRIRDLAIIDQLELELGPGLNVLTGETGAGKSILVSALELVLGGKGRAELVRTGAKAGEVEALFTLEGAGPSLRAALSALELDSGRAGGDEAGENELVLRRVLSACGRTRCFVNGRLVPQRVLGQLARGLTDISSQHDYHTLSDPATHLGFLDAFAHVGGLRQRLASTFGELKQAAAMLHEHELRGRDRAAREAALRARVREIEEVAPTPEEELELEQQCRRLQSVEALLRLTGEAAELLYERDDSVVDGLARAGRRIAEAAELDAALQPLAAQLEVLRGQLGDAARELGRHVREARPDPEALQRCEERLYLLGKLKRRHGGSLDAVLAQLAESRAELEALTQHASSSEALRLALAAALEQACSLARTLSVERRQAAVRLGAAISAELASLGMGGARIKVELVDQPGRAPGGPPEGGAGEFAVDGVRLTADGLERAEFLIAPNRGEEARPLHRVASGGELSRSMLAIKCVLADLGPAGMYAFDELDAGVGGGMAEVIGRKIRSVSQHRQVLCITHLPQIAVFADQHFKVEKFERGERTASSVRRLTGKEQREEIARMLGGLEITAKTRAAARELLQQARQVA
jgi:DNA repair protein RecN (Recombination protein N)